MYKKIIDLFDTIKDKVNEHLNELSDLEEENGNFYDDVRESYKDIKNIIKDVKRKVIKSCDLDDFDEVTINGNKHEVREVKNLICALAHDIRCNWSDCKHRLNLMIRLCKDAKIYSWAENLINRYDDIVFDGRNVYYCLDDYNTDDLEENKKLFDEYNHYFTCKY